VGYRQGKRIIDTQRSYAEMANEIDNLHKLNARLLEALERV